MPKLIFDIETIGEDFDSLDKTTQDSLTRWIKREARSDEEYQAKLKDLKEGLGFSPLTGEIVALGILDCEKNQAVVYFSAPNKDIKEYSKDNFIFKQKTEEEMLKSFWEGARKYQEFIGFNSRCFDVPFIMARSAKHKIKPTKNLMFNRYLSSQRFDAKHIDLLDQLSFYGAMQRKGSLHLWCRLFGIKSPKGQGVTGDEVSSLYAQGEYQKIAEYNSWDLRATRELYERWQEYFNI
ncbi:ribonuclease H-like domain-containing protein [Patescibacteria group bacterium]|nr:ribonuclease H-like domain-containing protein [Patescibacteria group bacterium]MBU4512487.1 ribonuclease H-like domain-containing protein [Patescibacteria group bacterium]